MLLSSSSLRTFAHRAFYQFHSREFRIVNDTLAMVTILSVVAIVLETVPSLARFTLLWNTIEYTAVAFFLAEYVLRISTERSPGRYIFSFYGVIDLVAILPSLLGIGNLIALKTARILRILRFLRVIRLAKITRVVVDEAHREARDLESYWDVFRLDLTIYMLTLVSATIMLGGVLYLVEPSNPAFSHIPEAMLWVFGTILGGIPNLGMPTTTSGMVVLLLTKFVGLILLGFLVSIIGKGIENIISWRSPRNTR